MSDTIKYLVRIISVEPFGNPTHYKVVTRIIGSNELVTTTLPVRPRFTLGEETTLRLG